MHFSPEEEARIDRAREAARRAWSQAFGQRARNANFGGISVDRRGARVTLKVSGLVDSEELRVMHHQPLASNRSAFYIWYDDSELFRGSFHPIRFTDEFGLKRALKQYQEVQAAKQAASDQHVQRAAELA